MTAACPAHPPVSIRNQERTDTPKEPPIPYRASPWLRFLRRSRGPRSHPEFRRRDSHPIEPATPDGPSRDSSYLTAPGWPLRFVWAWWISRVPTPPRLAIPQQTPSTYHRPRCHGWRYG